MIKQLCIVIVYSLLSFSAFATTYSNPQAGGVGPFGTSNTIALGETFNITSAQQLLNWSFYALNGSAGNMIFNIASWNGSHAVGPAVYTSSLYYYGGGAQAVTFNNVNTTLQAGDYVAYLTVAGVKQNPEYAMSFYMGANDGGLPGFFAFCCSGSDDPLSSRTNWHAGDPSYAYYMQYTANFAPAVSAVPEPNTYLMLLVGLAALSLISKMGVRRTGYQAMAV